MSDLVYHGVIRAAQVGFRALDLRIDVVGEEHIPPDGGAVVVMNHIGYLDFALAGVPFWDAQRRMVRFMAKQEVFRHRVSGPLMRAMQHIPVDRSAGSAAFRAAIDVLKRGELVGVFPEATISRSFRLKEFKTGAVAMARAARVPIIPMALWGTQRIWTKGHRPSWRGLRHLPIAMTIGAPLAGGGAAAADELRSAMEALLDQTIARYPDDGRGERWWIPADLGGGAPTPTQAAELDAAERAARVARRAAQ